MSENARISELWRSNRQRIADAPVVAWKRIEGMGSPVATEDYLKTWSGMRGEFPIPLISKEDLL